MKILVQWTLATPQGWQEYPHQAWQGLAKKPEPAGGETLDNTPGWIFAINCQGIVMRGYDHYAVQPVADAEWGPGVRFTLWQDDPDDFAPGTRWATIWELYEPAPDPQFPVPYEFRGQWLLENPKAWGMHGGKPVQVNTRQRRAVFAEPAANYPDLNVMPWERFTPPAEAITRHGIWTPDDHFSRAHKAAAHRGWQEWIT